jgi:hypothetical protein
VSCGSQEGGIPSEEAANAKALRWVGVSLVFEDQDQQLCISFSGKTMHMAHGWKKHPCTADKTNTERTAPWVSRLGLSGRYLLTDWATLGRCL